MSTPNKAQSEALQADMKDFLEDHVPGDTFIYMANQYRLCVMFEGKHDPVLFGWQL